jgi:hypothetical protein
MHSQETVRKLKSALGERAFIKELVGTKRNGLKHGTGKA